MEFFQKAVMIFFAVFLIIIFAFIGLSLRSQHKTQPWPPAIPQCPDYWIAENVPNSSETVCINAKKLGTCPQETMNFSDPLFSGTNGNCAKYNWAKGCNIAWDGITYGTSHSPCDTTSSTTLS